MDGEGPANYNRRGMKLVHRIAFVFVVAGVAAACAEGSTDVVGLGAAPSSTSEPTEPDSMKVPPPTNEQDPDPADPGDDGGTSNQQTDSGAGSTDSGVVVDAGTTVDSGTGTCTTTPPSNLCGLAPQCGCASNQTCDITNKTNGYVSCVAAGSAPLASPCTTSSQCAAGLTCAYGTCRPYCNAFNTACATPGTNKCAELWEPGASAAVPNGLVCTIPCDPRNPAPTCGSNTCIWDPSVSSTDCDKGGTKTLYEPCAAYNECMPGLACIVHPFFGPECETWCRVGFDGDCGIFEVCEDVYGANAPFIGTQKLGHCQ